MAQGNQHPEGGQYNPCCSNGKVINTCPDCGGQPRLVHACRRCGGAGLTWYPCPSCTDYTPTGSANATSGPSYAGSGGYGSGYANGGSSSNWQGQQGYGSAARQ